MGWASGSRLLQQVAQITLSRIPDDHERSQAAKQLIKAFEREDCDTINEVEQADVADAYEAMYGHA